MGRIWYVLIDFFLRQTGVTPEGPKREVSGVRVTQVERTSPPPDGSLSRFVARCYCTAQCVLGQSPVTTLPASVRGHH